MILYNNMRTRLSVSSYGITLQEAKDYLKVDNALEDDMLSSLISASYEQICAESNRDFAQSVYTQDIVSGSYAFITSQTVNAASTGSIHNDPDGAYLQFDDLWSGTVTYTVATGSVVPQNAKVAQLMLVALWYEDRNPFITGRALKIDFAIDALLTPYKLVRPY